MEAASRSALVLVFLLLALAVWVRWRSAPPGPRPSGEAGMLLVPAAPLCGALLDPQGRLRCLGCSLRWRCWVRSSIAAVEENEDRSGGAAARGGRQPSPGLDLEQVGRLLDAARALLDRLFELLTLPLTQQVIKVLGQLLRPLLARAAG